MQWFIYSVLLLFAAFQYCKNWIWNYNDFIIYMISRKTIVASGMNGFSPFFTTAVGARLLDCYFTHITLSLQFKVGERVEKFE